MTVRMPRSAALPLLTRSENNRAESLSAYSRQPWNAERHALHIVALTD